MIDGVKFDSNKKMKLNETAPIWIRVDESALPKDIKYGDKLKGSLVFQKNSEVEFTYTAPTNKTNSSTDKTDDSALDEKESEAVRLEKSILKANVDFLTKLVDKKAINEFEVSQKIFFSSGVIFL